MLELLSTGGENENGVVPQSGVLKSSADVPHGFVHRRHHPRVLAPPLVLDEAVGGDVALGDLQGRVNRLQRHIEEERLRSNRNIRQSSFMRVYEGVYGY